jgi:general secretion pathway protein G
MRTLPRRHGQTRGFTLLELLLVILILSILALLVVPRLMGAGRYAREAALKADLRELRSAIERFGGDVGRYPSALEELYLQNSVPEDDRRFWKGPYLRTDWYEVPRDPITGKRDWRYDPTTGHVRTASTETALDGTHYSDW